jgi:hypothetical protein
VLTQAIEGAGSMDREAVTDHLKSHTYQTMLGEYDLRNQLLDGCTRPASGRGDGFTRSRAWATRFPITFRSS